MAAIFSATSCFFHLCIVSCNRERNCAIVISKSCLRILLLADSRLILNTLFLRNKKGVHFADNKQDTERCEFCVLKITNNLGVFDIMLFLIYAASSQ